MKRFFSPPGVYEPCGLFGIEHLILLLASIALIIAALYISRNMSCSRIRKTILLCTIVLWVFEIVKIVFNLIVNEHRRAQSLCPFVFLQFDLILRFYECVRKRLCQALRGFFFGGRLHNRRHYVFALSKHFSPDVSVFSLYFLTKLPVSFHYDIPWHIGVDARLCRALRKGSDPIRNRGVGRRRPCLYLKQHTRHQSHVRFGQFSRHAC